MTTNLLSFLSDVKTPVMVLCAICGGWFAVMAVSMLLFEPTGHAVALVRDHTILERLPDDISLTRTGDHSITLYSEKPGFVRRIYAAGAFAVFPSLKNGCLDLRNLENG